MKVFVSGLSTHTSFSTLGWFTRYDKLVCLTVDACLNLALCSVLDLFF